MRPLPPGTTVGAYVIEAEIARGGMGAVYRARRSFDGGVVALKLLRTGGAASAEQLVRFQREGQTAAKLAHPGIVRVHDAGIVAGLPFIAMDLVDGEPLSARVGRVAPLEAARLVAQVARAIEHAHAHGVVHRDLKPDNVLVKRDDGRPVVTDFGIARDLESGALTKTGALVGTPHYMSPEQARGQPATSACDVHALGVLLYETITGVPPFRADDLGGLLVQITERSAERPSALTRGVPRALDDLVAKVLAKRPEARPSAAELAAALEVIAEGKEVTRRAPARALIALGAAAALIIGLLAARAPREADSPVAVEAPKIADAPPPAAPEWTGPPWLRALDARGLEALLEVHDALDAAPEVDPRTRARALEVVARLDAAWKEPAPADPDRADRLDALLWLHWLWNRLDPARPLGARAAIFERNASWRPSGLGDPWYMVRVGRATVAVEPTDLDGYIAYETFSRALEDELPWSARDGDLLLQGVREALRQKDDGAFGRLAQSHGEWLVKSGADVARVRAFAREVEPEAARAPDEIADVLARAAERVPPEEAYALLDRAEALAGNRSVGLVLRRAGVMARDPTREAEAAGVAEQALLLAAPIARHNPRDVTRAAALAAELHMRGDRTVQARHVLERAMTLEDAGPQAGLAMRLAVILAETDAHGDALQGVLYELIARLTEHLKDTRRRSGERDALARITAAIDAARSVEGARTAPPVKAALAPWKDPRALEALDR